MRPSCALLLLFLAAGQDPPPVRVSAVRPQVEDLHRAITLPAFLRPQEEAVLIPRVDGVVVSLPAEEGDLLHKGDPVATLDAPELPAALARAEAELERARARGEAALAAAAASRAVAEAARVEMERVRGLHEDGAATIAELERAQAAQAVAEARAAAGDSASRAAASEVAVARAILREARVRDAYRFLTCPYDNAVVTARLGHPGASVRAGETGLVRLAVVDPLRVRMGVPEKDAPFARRGTPVRFRADAVPGLEIRTEIVRTARAIAEGSQALTVEAEVPNADQALMPGMFGRATLVLGSMPAALTLPGSVILTGADGEPYVWVISEGRARRRDLTLGLDDGLRVEVLSGLTREDAVIAGGRERVREGSPVETGTP